MCNILPGTINRPTDRRTDRHTYKAVDIVVLIDC